MSSNTPADSAMALKRPPRFSLAPCVAVNTPPPPVVLGAKWRSMYPVAASPFKTAAAASTNASVPPYVDVAQGVPSGLPSQELLDRFAREEAKQQHHSYRPAPAELADALALRINETYRGGRQDGAGAVTKDDISITAGCNMASETAFRMIAQTGGQDAIVLTTPYYFNHAMQLSALNIATAYLPCSAPDFFPDPAKFKALLDHHKASDKLPTIKGIALVTPNNPTGSIYPPSLIAEFARICHEERIALILDETYREFLVPREGDTQTPAEATRPHGLFEDTLSATPWDWRSTLIHLYSFSKSFAIPGHRLGALVCHPILRSIESFKGINDEKQYGPLATLLDNTVIVPPRYDTQLALAWALNDAEQIRFRRQVATTLVQRLRTLEQAFSAPVPDEEYHKWDLTPVKSGYSAEQLGWQIVCRGGQQTSMAAAATTPPPQGGYFVFVKHPFNDGEAASPVPAATVAEALSTLTGVGTLPEDFFLPSNPHAATHHLRVSLANVKDQEDLKQVPIRMALLSSVWEKHGRKSFGIANR